MVQAKVIPVGQTRLDIVIGFDVKRPVMDMLKDILDQKSSTMGYENEIPRPPRSRCYVRL